MTLWNLSRLLFSSVLLWLLTMICSSLCAQSLPYYKSEKIIVGEEWMKNINTVQTPRILKSTRVGHAGIKKAGKGYLLQYDNRGIAEYDTIVFTADGKIHAYALKNQFIRAKADYYIADPNEDLFVDVLENDDTYSEIYLTDIPYEEGVKASIENDKVRLQTSKSGLHYFYYTVCDGSNQCDEAKVTVFVRHDSNRDTIILSEVTDQQLKLPLPNAQYNLVQSTIDHVYPDGEGTFDVDLFRRDLGQNKILFQSPEGKSLLYKINYIDKWGDNQLNTSDKVYVHPGKSVEVSLTDNDLWVNVYRILSSSSNIQVSSTGGGRVNIQPKPGFSGKASFQYVSCAYPRCDTATVNVYVDHFKPAKDQFDIFVDPSVAYHIPFYTPLHDYNLAIKSQPKQGHLDLIDGGLSMVYTPGPHFKGEDRAKISYSYQTSDGIFESIHYIRFMPSPHPFRGNCTDCVWPGDTDENGVVDLADVSLVARYIGEHGPKRLEGILWKGQWNYPWVNFENEKLHHFDADGDGLIAWDDLKIIVEYFGKTHGLYAAPVTWMDVPLEIDRSKENISPGDDIVFEFNVGNENNELYNVTGFSTEVKIEGRDLSTAEVEVVRDAGNWLKSHQPTLALKAQSGDNGRVAAGEFRVRSVGVKGYGTALKLRIIVEDEVEGFRTLRAKSNGLKFIFQQIKLHTTNGDIHLPNQIIEIPLQPTNKIDDSNHQQPRVYPNPAGDQITISRSNSEQKYTLEILDLRGTQKKHYIVKSGVESVNLSVDQLTPGVYILRCSTGDETWNRKLTIIR